MPVTFGDGAGEGDGEAAGPGGAGVDPAKGVAAAWGLGCCALGLNALAAKIPDNRRNARSSQFVVLLFILVSTFVMMRRYGSVW